MDSESETVSSKSKPCTAAPSPKVSAGQGLQTRTLKMCHVSYIHIYIHMYTYCIYAYCIYTYCIFVDVCSYVGMCMCVCVCMYVCMYVWMYGCMDVCMHACMHACIHVCMHALIPLSMCAKYYSHRILNIRTVFELGDLRETHSFPYQRPLCPQRHSTLEPENSF